MLDRMIISYSDKADDVHRILPDKRDIRHPDESAQILLVSCLAVWPLYQRFKEYTFHLLKPSQLFNFGNS